MPRCKPKLSESTVVVVTGQKKRNKNSKVSNNEISNETDNIHVKEELESPAGGSDGLDLSQFKFEKRPHVKIVFEKDSAVKEVGTYNLNAKFNDFPNLNNWKFR